MTDLEYIVRVQLVRLRGLRQQAEAALHNVALQIGDAATPLYLIEQIDGITKTLEAAVAQSAGAKRGRNSHENPHRRQGASQRHR